MIIFLQKNTGRYLITNYKVMYSTLSKQEHLERIKNKIFVARKILERVGLQSKTEVHFIIRNPETRLQSFFINKFRQNIQKRDNSEWEHCQKIFFQLLGINTNDSPNSIESKFRAFSYQDFIQSLKDHYLKDAHLIPQSNMIRLKLKGFTLPIDNNPEEIYILEKQTDLERLAQNFQLDLGIKENTSKNVNTDFALSESQKEIIQTLYKEDYQLYNKWNHHS